MVSVHFQLVVAAHQVIIDISIKVTTQTTHTALHTKNVCNQSLISNTVKQGSIRTNIIILHISTRCAADMWTRRRVPLSQLREMSFPSSTV